MYYFNRFKDAKGDIRKTWGLITSIINNGINKTEELKIDNAICTAPNKIANKFNYFYKHWSKPCKAS